MSLLLCRQEPVKCPYYVEALDLHLYSSQELCYVIYHHPFLVMEDFVDEGLLEFIRVELNMGFLAGKLEKWRASGENPDEMLLSILSECFYYGPAEVNQYRQQVAALRKKHPAEYKKERADYLFGIRQYGRAVEIYEGLTESPKDQVVDDAFLGRVWNNLGAAYARLFQTAKAYHAFEKAYGCLGEEAMVKRMYFLTRFNPQLEQLEGPLSAVKEETRKAWEREADAAQEKAAQSREILKLEQLFGQEEEKRDAGAAELVTRWKQEYRSSVF